MGTMASGMAFGAGSEIAHQGVRAMMGGGSGHGSAPVEQAAPQQQVQPAYDSYGGQQQQVQQEQYNPCAAFGQGLQQCLTANTSDIQACQNYMNALQQCQNDNFGPSQTNYQ